MAYPMGRTTAQLGASVRLIDFEHPQKQEKFLFFSTLEHQLFLSIYYESLKYIDAHQMAEVLGLVASGISVAQIAGQLLGCIKQLCALCRALRDTPEELQGILEELEILGEIHYQLGTLQPDSSRLGHNALRLSLINCRKAASNLEVLVTRSSRSLQADKKRPWHLVKVVLKREEIKELKAELEAAKSLLHLSMTWFSLNMQQRSINLLEVQNIGNLEIATSSTDDVTINSDVTLLHQNSSTALHVELPRRKNLLPRSTCVLGKCHCTCHALRTQSGKFWSLKIPSHWSRCDRLSCSNYRHASFWISLNSIGIPYAIHASLKFMFSVYQSYIAPSLLVYNVVDWDAPAFAILDIKWNPVEYEEAREQLSELFSSGKASPFDILPDGKSLLEKLLILPWPDGGTQLKLLEFLVMSGCPLNTSRILQRCTDWKGLGKWRTGLNNHQGGHTQLMNRLLTLGFDPSEVEAPFSNLPQECSPILSGYKDLDYDVFFVNWIAEGVKVFPGFAGSTPLQEAILIDSADTVKKRLDRSTTELDQNNLHQSSVHLAVWRPQHLEALLEEGFDVNAQDWTGRTPLMYAASAGSVDVAISLLRHGADPWIQDNLFGSHGFLNYASRSGHWEFIMAVLDFIRQSTLFSADEVQTLLNVAIVLWAGAGIERRQKDLPLLLNWGADPEIRFTDMWRFFKASGNTLLHCITSPADLNALVAGGFKSFNHPNSTGSHGLMAVARLQTSIFSLEPHIPHLVPTCIKLGSRVNHQDHMGRTTLHIVMEVIWESFLFHPFNDCRLRSNALNCAEVLLANDADPFLGDHCRCACSRNGCTPGHILLKEHLQIDDSEDYETYPLGQYVLVFEFFELLGNAQSFEYTKTILRDIARLRRFEELELTHTCCRKPRKYIKAYKGEEWTKLDEDEVVEIRDEEKELITTLETELQDMELGWDSDVINEVWQEEIFKLLETRARNASYLALTGGSNVSNKAIINLKEYYDLTSTEDYLQWIRSPDWKSSPRGETSVGLHEQREKWVSRLKAKVLESKTSAYGQDIFRTSEDGLS